MALIKCSRCGQIMSDKASTCPGCGNPVSRQFEEKPTTSLPKIAFVILIVAVFVAVGYGLYSNSRSSIETTSVDSLSEDSEQIPDELEEARQTYSEREQKKIQQYEDMSWMYGTWTYTAYGSTSKFVISRDNITIYYDGSIEYNGTYEIRGNELHYNTHNGMSDYIIIDHNSQRLKADESSFLSKVSSSESNVSSESSSRDNGDYNQYSTNEGRQAYLEVLQLQKEVRALIDRSAPYRSIMQREVYGSYNYQTARMQNMDILDAAIQKQEKALRIAKDKLQDESLIRELSGQLETLKKAQYSD